MAAFSYACRDYPGMGMCPGKFEAESESELWQHLELHGRVAHQEDPAKWSPEEKAEIHRLIKRVST